MTIKSLESYQRTKMHNELSVYRGITKPLKIHSAIHKNRLDIRGEIIIWQLLWLQVAPLQ